VMERPWVTDGPWVTARPRETARPWVTARPRKIRQDPERGRNPKNRGESPETPKVGGTPQNSGETLKKQRDRKIGGSTKTGGLSKVAGSVEDHRRMRNLDDGPSPPTLERMKRSGQDGIAAGNRTRQSTT
jgi:hypothetical protein